MNLLAFPVHVEHASLRGAEIAGWRLWHLGAVEILDDLRPCILHPMLCVGTDPRSPYLQNNITAIVYTVLFLAQCFLLPPNPTTEPQLPGISALVGGAQGMLSSRARGTPSAAGPTNASGMYRGPVLPILCGHHVCFLSRYPLNRCRLMGTSWARMELSLR